jgi:hypothetical protein
MIFAVTNETNWRMADEFSQTVMARLQASRSNYPNRTSRAAGPHLAMTGRL